MTPPQPTVISGVRYVLAHTPGLVRYGSRPGRVLEQEPALLEAIRVHSRPFAQAAAYPPNRAFLGALHPDALHECRRPWFRHAAGAERHLPHGECWPQAEFYGLLKLFDEAGLVALSADFTREVAPALAAHPLLEQAELARLGEGVDEAALMDELRDSARRGPPALPLEDGGRVVGLVRGAHEADAALAAEVLLENLAAKTSAIMALRDLVAGRGIDPVSIAYVLNTGEEAVGDRYQRGGGNLAKAVAEHGGCPMASGVDIKGFCCGPVQGLAIAGGLVAAGLFPRVAVVGGGSLAKLGMKFQGHLKHEQPILEDVLAAVAILVEPDDGHSPRLRLDALGLHPVSAGGSQKEIFTHLVAEPLRRLGLRFGEVDKYATELHNPEVTEPAGSGDVPLLNYRVIAGLAALAGEIGRADLPAFVRRHGMPGFSPTQGHIASAVPFLGHALDGLRAGSLQRTLFLAKGSLFLGRMTRMADGVSVMLERNG